MRNPIELGMKPRRRASFGILDVAQVEALQAHFGIILPKDYVALLRVCNGGYPRLRYYLDPQGGTSEVNDFYGLGTLDDDLKAQSHGQQSWDHGNLWSEIRIWMPVIGRELIPIGRDGGNNQLALETRSGSSAVFKVNAATRTTRLIAGSFSEFLDMLTAELPE